MLSAQPPWNPRFLTLHLEELEVLWNQRLRAWEDAAWTRPALRRLDGRIAAHADALVLAGDEATLLLEEALEGGAPTAALGAAHVLLSREDLEGEDRAHAELAAAAGRAAEAFRVALRHAPVVRHAAALRRLAGGPDEARAVAALSALAFHAVDADLGRLVELVDAGEPSIRARAWEAVAYVGAEAFGQSRLASLRTFLSERARGALGDPAPEVGAAALQAAAWTRQRWVLEHVRAVASAGAPAPAQLPALHLLAILGEERDRAAVRSVARRPELGARRLSLLGVLGEAQDVEELLQALDSDDSEEAAEAARAYRRSTGVELPSVSDPEAFGAAGDHEEPPQRPDAAFARESWERALALRAAGSAEELEPVLAAELAAALRVGARKASLERLQGGPA